MSGSFKKTRPNEMRLIPLKPKSNYKSEMVYNFERINPKTQEREVDLPTLNFDTPAWMPGILASHERVISENNPNVFEEGFFAKRGQDDEEEMKLLLLPKPPKKSTFCGLCEQIYEDYYTHVNSDEHMNKFRNNMYVEDLLNEAKAMQEEFQNEVLNKLNFDEITLKQPNNDQKEIRYSNSEANKENNQLASNEKKNRTVRRLNHVFYEDCKEQLENVGRQNPVMGRKIKVQKVFGLPTETAILTGEKHNPAIDEENQGNNLHNWMFNPQDSIKKLENTGESAEKSRHLKRKYPTFTESDQEVLNNFKKVKITDDSGGIQEDQKSIQIPVNFLKGTFNSLMNAFSEGLGNLKMRLFNQFGISN